MKRVFLAAAGVCVLLLGCISKLTFDAVQDIRDELRESAKRQSEISEAILRLQRQVMSNAIDIETIKKLSMLDAEARRVDAIRRAREN